MTLTQILIFAGLGLLASRLYRWLDRAWLLFAASVLAAFWLQPASFVRNLPYLLPLASLGLAVLVWALTLPRRWNRQDAWAAAGLAALALLVSASRVVEPLSALSPARPPGLELAGGGLALLAVAAVLAYRLGRGQAAWLHGGVLLLIGLLVVLKSPPLVQAASAWLRGLGGQDPALASTLDLGWLGFSYIAFRLIHVLRDRLAGRLGEVGLRDFITYIVFFPALTAGPIERVERFVPQLEPGFVLDSAGLLAAGQRLLSGLVMKFVLADGLAFFALNPVNAWQVSQPLWMWLLLLAYALRIFFDFAGYTSIAIGLGQLFGVTLPENFTQPYRKPNLTQFWNSWHITLAQWFRAYFFNPFTRWLRGRGAPVWLVVLLGQLSTMGLIGLWHGITWNFLAWGLWHGLGLFAHNQWAQFAKARPLPFEPRLASGLGWLATLVFVALGWVWFALPQPADAAHVFGVLAGVGVGR
ncbi:MAG: MBOAT family protein [Anaerolineales bacterium]|nr:MBOAT family protein [Anaerolineales bacterium]MCW5856174.1 MBOAT family protein [Anaerolineales bacterium]